MNCHTGRCEPNRSISKWTVNKWPYLIDQEGKRLQTLQKKPNNDQTIGVNCCLPLVSTLNNDVDPLPPPRTGEECRLVHVPGGCRPQPCIVHLLVQPQLSTRTLASSAWSPPRRTISSTIYCGMSCPTPNMVRSWLTA